MEAAAIEQGSAKVQTGWARLWSSMAAALVAVLVGFGGILTLIVQVSQHLGATPDQTASWVVTLCLAIAGSIFLSVRYRMPITLAFPRKANGAGIGQE